MPGLLLKISESLAVGTDGKALVDVQFAAVPRSVMAPNLPLAPVQTKVVMRGLLACLPANLPYPAPLLQGRHGSDIGSLITEKFLAVNRFFNKTKTPPGEFGFGE